MNIEIEDVLTLDNDEDYIVVSKCYVDGINYYYLIQDTDDYSAMFCYEEREELVEIKDVEKIREIIPCLYKTAKSKVNSEKLIELEKTLNNI